MNEIHWFSPVKSLLALLILGLLIIGCTATSGQLNDISEPAASSFAGEGLSITNNSEAQQSIRPTAVPALSPSPTPLPQPIIPTPTAEPEPTVAIDPLTNPDAILATINEFAALQEAALIGQPGWIHVRRVEVNYSRPMNVLVPEGASVFESWYHVDETGLIYEGLGLVTSIDGRIYQHTVLFDGNWINITIEGYDFTPQSTTNHPPQRFNLSTVTIANQLEEVHKSPNVNLSAQIIEGYYQLTWESQFEEPIETTSPLPQGLAVRDKQILTFDPETGQLLSQILYFYLEDGAEILVIDMTEEAEFRAELPPDKASLFYDTVHELKNE